MRTIAQIFVAFSEKLNFRNIQVIFAVESKWKSNQRNIFERKPTPSWPLSSDWGHPNIHKSALHCSGLISYHFFNFFQVPQTSLNYVIEKCSDAFAQALRSLSLLTWRHLPMIASFLSRVQFFAQWAVQKHRSDFLHNPISTRSSIEYFK